jgi:hypothetical protein
VDHRPKAGLGFLLGYRFVTVSLSQSKDIRLAGPADQVLRILCPKFELPAGYTELDLTQQLEQAFDNSTNTWFQIAKDLGQEPSAGLAHMPACVANASDFGQMLAWTRVISSLASEQAHTRILVDDPWLYRQFSTMNEFISVATKPPLWPKALQLMIRGYVARLKCTFNLASNLLKFQHQRKVAKHNSPVLLAYGHTNSTPDGSDGYFGDILKNNDDFSRVLHVDCRGETAAFLCQSPTTTSLHAWGSFRDLLPLAFAYWRPQAKQQNSSFKWLIKRAAALEAGSAQAAMIEWQIRCQKRWLTSVAPKTVVWPWENQSWEREFTRAAKQARVHTVGYQHSVIGRQMLNYSQASNPDDDVSIPDRIICTGKSTLKQLKKWGISKDKLIVGGAFRFPIVENAKSISDGPIYFALPFDPITSKEMIECAQQLVPKGFTFVVKPHPMMPHQFSESSGIQKTDNYFFEEEGLSAVVYSASAVGLEALLAGLPTIRFQPFNRISSDILPPNISVPASGAAQLEEALRKIEKPPNIGRQNFFSPVSIEIWQKELRYETN